MFNSCLFSLIMLLPQGQVPTYFIKLIQERTLYTQSEPVMLVVRLGNQFERTLKSKRFPKLLESLVIQKDGVTLPLASNYSSKRLFQKVGALQYGEHRDFRLNLMKYFPNLKEGGIFKISYHDDSYQVLGKNISIVKMPPLDLNVHYILKTNKGDIKIQLNPNQAPNHARNFAILVAMRFYEKMIFHRVERGFVIQTGDPLGNGNGGSGFSLALEKSPFLKHDKYAVGMARGTDLDSASSQFYICLEPTPSLDSVYTVFGRVTGGFDVVDTIGAVQTGIGKDASKPIKDVVLYSIEAHPN